MRKIFVTIVATLLLSALFSGSAFAGNGVIKNIYPPGKPKVALIEGIDNLGNGLGRPYYIYIIGDMGRELPPLESEVTFELVQRQGKLGNWAKGTARIVTDVKPLTDVGPISGD